MTETRTDDGVAIEYKVYGEGPLTLLFLHGWCNAASAWDDLVTTRLNLAGLRSVAASFPAGSLRTDTIASCHSSVCVHWTSNGRSSWQ